MSRLWTMGAASALLLTVGAGPVVARAPFAVGGDASGNMSAPAAADVYETVYGIDDATDEEDTVPEYLEGAKCGGWNLNLSVGNQLGTGLIAKVTGMPGWEGLPLGNPKGGMSMRIDQVQPMPGQDANGFLFPDTTQGFATVCKAGGPDKVTIEVWDDTAHARIPKQFDYPFFQDPACLWVPKRTNGSFASSDNLPHPPLSPEKCDDACDWLNTFTYKDCDALVPTSSSSSSSSSSDGGTTGGPIGGDISGTIGSNFGGQNGGNIGTNDPINNGGDIGAMVIFGGDIGVNDPINNGGGVGGILVNGGDMGAILINGGSNNTFFVNGGSPGGGDIFVTGGSPGGGDVFVTGGTPGGAGGAMFTNTDIGGFMVTGGAVGGAGAAGAMLTTGNTGLFFMTGDTTPLLPSVLPSPLAGAVITVNSSSSSSVDTSLVCDPNKWKLYYICTRQPVPSALWSNCRPCVGDACRCPGPGCPAVPPGGTCNTLPRCAGDKVCPAGQICQQLGSDSCGGTCVTPQYQSFYRKYQGGYARQAVTQTDQAAQSVEVACYGFYHQYDPKYAIAQPRDYRCSVAVGNIATPLDTYPQSQEGKGEYGQNSRWPDPLPLRRGFSLTTDVWRPISGAFTMINELVFKKKYGNDLGSAYLDLQHLDSAEERATHQLSAALPLAKSNTAQEFDNTGLGSVTRWWRTQQTIVKSQLAKRPTVHLLLPSAWVLGPGEDEAPFRTSAIRPQTGRDPRSEAVHVQVEAGEDIAGAVLDSLRLHVEELPIRLALPSVDIHELLAVKEAWCMRYIQDLAGELQQEAQDGRQAIANVDEDDDAGGSFPTCDDVPPALQDFFAKIDAYIAYQEKMRELRTAIAGQAGALLKIQNDISAPVVNALAEYMEEYSGLLSEQAKIESQLLPVWDDANQIYRTFNDVTNQPWCMNQRYTHVVDFLNDWMASRQNNGSVYQKDPNAALNLPTLEGLDRPVDLVIDLSDIHLNPGPLTIPVFKPTLVHINLPKPPSTAVRIADTSPSLPNPPPIDPLLIAINAVRSAMPTVDASDVQADISSFPQPLGDAKLASILATLTRIRDTVENMNDMYAYFWDSPRSFSGNTDVLPPTCIDGNAGNATITLQSLQCCSWNQRPCLTEMDLLTTVTRAASRPGIGVQEDIEAVAFPRAFPTTCLDTDPGCTIVAPELLPPHLRLETYMTQTNNIPLGTLQQTVRKLTLPPPIGSANLPPLGVQPGELPPIETPYAPVDLIP